MPLVISLILVLFSTLSFAQSAGAGCNQTRPLRFERILTCAESSTEGLRLTGEGEITGTGSEESFPVLPCDKDSGSTGPGVWYNFIASGTDQTITITSSTLRGLQLVVYRGAQCEDMVAEDCIRGTSTVQLAVGSVPGEHFYFRVSSEDLTDTGSFDFSIQATMDCTPCNTRNDGVLRTVPAVPSAIFNCGQTVTMCFELRQWIGNAEDREAWLHALIPQFGSGWDVSSLELVSTPGSCNGTGQWRWYSDGWTGGRCTPTPPLSPPYGIAYESTNGTSPGCGEGPGDNYGDGGPGCTTYPAPARWCWTIAVADCSDSTVPADLSATVRVYSDGDTGGWNAQGCLSGKTTYRFLGTTAPCPDTLPLVTFTPASCPNTADGSLSYAGDGGRDALTAFNFSVRTPDGTLLRCDNCRGSQTLDNLLPGRYEIEATNVSSNCTRIVEAIVPSGPSPDAQIRVANACPDDGPIQLIGTTSSTASDLLFAWTGPDGFEATGDTVFTRDPAEPGVYSLTVTAGDCASAVAMADVEYAEFYPELQSDQPDTVCFGEDVSFTVAELGRGGTVTWFTPEGANIGGNANSITVEARPAGWRRYRAVVSQGECQTIMNADFFVQPEIEVLVLPVPSQNCTEDTITFSALQPDGSPLPADWAFSWEGNDLSGATYSRRRPPVGDYEIELTVITPDGCPIDLSAPFSVKPAPTLQLPTFGPLCAGADTSILLTAEVTNSDHSGTLRYTATPGVAGTTFSSRELTAGTYQIKATFTEAGCATSDSTTIQILPAPEVSFTLDRAVACPQQTVVATAAVLSSQEVADFSWQYALAENVQIAAEGQRLELSWADSGTQEIGLFGTSDNGCRSDTFFQSLEIVAPLPPPEVSCTPQTSSSVLLQWSDIPGATGYRINHADGTETIQDSTRLLVENITPSTPPEIRLTTLGPLACAHSTPVPVTSCQPVDCPDFQLDTSALPTQICLETGAETLDLRAVRLEGSRPDGQLRFRGDGVSAATFNAAQAGGSESGIAHTIIVDYTDDVACTFTDSFSVTVFTRPSAFIIAQPTRSCVGDTVRITIGSTNFVPNDSIMIDFGNSDVLPDDNPDDNVYLLSWSVPGTDAVTATVISNISGCTSLPARREILIGSPPPSPTLRCPAEAALTQIRWQWAAVAGATGYELVLSTGDTLLLPPDSTGFTLTGLSPATTVEARLTARSDDACGNAPPAVRSCTTAACPEIRPQITVDNIVLCLDENPPPTLLAAVPQPATTEGNIRWSGPGVRENNGRYTFVADGLSAGEYTLVATYEGSAGCQQKDSIVAELFTTPELDLQLSNDRTCVENPVVVTIPTDADLTYTWDAGASPGRIDTLSLQTFLFTWFAAGSYDIRLTAQNGGCAVTRSATVTVSAPPPPPALTTDTLSLCQDTGAIVILDALLTFPDPAGQWGFLDFPTGAAAQPPVSSGRLPISDLPSGDYVLFYTLTDSLCPADTATLILRILPHPQADAGGDQQIDCSTTPITLTGNATTERSNYRYRWFTTDPDLQLADPHQPSVQVTVPGTYILEVDNGACTALDTVLVTAAAESEAPTLQARTQPVSCFGFADGQIIVEQISGGRPPYRYELNGRMQPVNTTIFTDLPPQEHLLRVTDARGCATELRLEVLAPEVFSVDLQRPDEIIRLDPREAITLTARVRGGGALDTLFWNPDSLNTLQQGMSITFPATASRIITVTAFDENGCQASDQVRLVVPLQRQAYFPTAFSPNGDGINDRWFVRSDAAKIDFIEELRIFNRWGSEIFNSRQLPPAARLPGGNGRFLPNDPVAGWDGTHNGRPLAAQVFVYTASVHFRDGSVTTFRGEITLVR